MSARDDELILPKATKTYLQRIDKSFEKTYAMLAATAARPSEYYYSEVSQYVHAHPAFANISKNMEKNVIAVPRDKGFLKLCAYADEFVSDLYSTFYRHNWDSIPTEIQANLKKRLGGKLPKFIEL